MLHNINYNFINFLIHFYHYLCNLKVSTCICLQRTLNGKVYIHKQIMVILYINIVVQKYTVVVQ